jgi:hypothetical protein
MFSVNGIVKVPLGELPIAGKIDMLVIKPNVSKSDDLQHLYIVSDEEIKEGDFVLLPNNTIQKMSNSDMIEYLSSDSLATKKIIATTNMSLSLVYDGKSSISDNWSKTLPHPSQSFIDKYITEYNKGNIITDILVEYEDIPFITYGDDGDKGLKRLKVNPKDNTINIKIEKVNYTSEEVKHLLLELADIMEDKVTLEMHEETSSGNIFTMKPKGYCNMLREFNYHQWITEKLNK